jgi:hypothetical protein
VDIAKSTPAGKIPRWRSTIKRAIILKFNGTNINNKQDLIQAITQARKIGLLTAQCKFAIIKHQAIQPTEVSLMLHYDQLNIKAKPLHSAYPSKTKVGEIWNHTDDKDRRQHKTEIRR